MRFFDTTRRRRMRLTGSWSIEYGLNIIPVPFITTDNKSSSIAAGFRPVVTGAPDLWVGANIGATLTGLPAFEWRLVVRLGLLAYNTSASFVLLDTNIGAGTYSGEFAASGTYEVALDMEEFWYHDDGRFTSPDAISRLAGPHDSDQVPTRRGYVTRPRIGGNVTARITSGSNEALDSQPITIGMQTDWTNPGGSLPGLQPYASRSASCYSRVNRPSVAAARRLYSTASASCTASLEIASGAAALSPPSFTSTNLPGSTGSHTAATSVLGLWTGTPDNPSLVSGDYEGRVTSIAYLNPVERHRLTADIRSGSGGYATGSWDVQVLTGSSVAVETLTTTTGRIDKTYTRDGRQVRLVFGGGGGSGGGGSASETVLRLTETSGTPNPIITGASLFPQTPSLILVAGSHGVPIAAPRMLLRGRKWLSRRLAQASSYSYGRTGTAGAWELSRVTASTHITKSITGGVLRLEASGSFEGGMAATIDSQSDRAEFRYHNLRWRRVDAGTGTMRVKRGEMSLASDPMVWDCPATGTGTWADATKDVLDPDDSVPTVVQGSMSPDVVLSVFAPNWEVHLPSGAGTWEIDYLEGTRQSFTEATLLNAPMPNMGGTPDACTDGMSLSDYEGPSWRTALSIPPNVSKPWYPIPAPWKWASWTWGNGTPDYTDMSYWYDSDLGVQFYEGGDGLLLDGDALAIPQRLDLRQAAISNNDPALSACDLLERATAYPGFGDGFFESAGGFGELVAFRFGHIVGPRAVGVVRQVGGGTMPQIEARNNGTAITGPATPGTEGFFVVPATLERSGATPGLHDLRLLPEVDTGQRLAFTVGPGSAELVDRDMIYSLWLSTTEGEGIALARSATGRITRAYNEATTIRMEYLTGPDLASWADGVDTDEEGQDPDIAYVGTDGRLYLSWTTGAGAIKHAWTINEGRTLEGMATVFSGSGYSVSRMAVSPTAIIHHFAIYDDAGTNKIRTRVLDAQGNELIAVTTIVASDVADGTLAACWLIDGPMIEYRKASSGNIVTVKSSDGVTFA